MLSKFQRKIQKIVRIISIFRPFAFLSTHPVISTFLLQSECRILLSKHSEENIVLQAVMDEFEENREKGNLTAELLNREKVR